MRHRFVEDNKRHGSITQHGTREAHGHHRPAHAAPEPSWLGSRWGSNMLPPLVR